MKRFLLVIIAFTLTANSFAATINAQTLNSVLDNFQYDVTVNWDQKDQQAYADIENKLYEELRGIEGLEVEDMYSVLETRIKTIPSSQIQQEIAAIKNKNLNDVDTFKEILNVLNSHKVQGAAWTPSNGLVIAGVLVLTVGVYFFLRAVLGQPYYCWDENMNSYECENPNPNRF